MSIDWSEMRPGKRLPTRREKGRYLAWVRYLRDSKLSMDEVHKRAAAFTESNHKLPDDFA